MVNIKYLFILANVHGIDVPFYVYGTIRINTTNSTFTSFCFYIIVDLETGLYIKLTESLSK